MTILEWYRKWLTPEAEAALEMPSRRKFLFLGAAAGAMAIADPLSVLSPVPDFGEVSWQAAIEDGFFREDPLVRVIRTRWLAAAYKEGELFLKTTPAYDRLCILSE